jgi:CTP:molybdopterin cytidylyltransferase MocA
VAGAVLSGGASRRMGQPKALLPWPIGHPRATVLSTVVDTLLGAGVAPLCVVSGTHHEAIAAAFGGDPRTSLVYNPRHAQGQITSLWQALDWVSALADTPEWLLVTPIDLPRVLPGTVERLVAVAADAGRALAVRPACAGRHGHPVLWHRDGWPFLRAASPDEGARPVIRGLAVAGLVLDVVVDDEGVLQDIDTPEEYARAGRRDEDGPAET